MRATERPPAGVGLGRGGCRRKFLTVQHGVECAGFKLKQKTRHIVTLPLLHIDICYSWAGGRIGYVTMDI